MLLITVWLVYDPLDLWRLLRTLLAISDMSIVSARPALFVATYSGTGGAIRGPGGAVDELLGGSLGGGLVTLGGAVLIADGCSLGGGPKPNCPCLACLLALMPSVILNPGILSIALLM